MANDRIYLKCNVCGALLYLGKSFAQGFYYVNYDKERDSSAPSLDEKLNMFYDKHAFCGDSHSDGDFSLIYESDM